MKLTFVFFALAILATLGLGFWLAFSSPLVTELPRAEMGAVPATPVAMPEQIAGRAPLISLLDQTEALECAFRFSNQDYIVEGNSFVADGQLRVDALYTMVDGESVVSSFILTDHTTYVWTDKDSDSLALMFPTDGAAMDFEAVDENETGQFINPEETVQYTCVLWETDNSIFIPPTSLEFADLGAILEGSMDMDDMKVPR